MAIDRTFLEIKSHEKPGYEPMVDFQSWRVALLNRDMEHIADGIRFLERHNETDEVFVLLAGKCTLFIGEGKGVVEDIHACQMEEGKLYNVRRAVWHNCALSTDAKVLIVENRDTTRENSNYFDLSEEQRSEIVRLGGGV